jgi:hypothetical protein
MALGVSRFAQSGMILKGFMIGLFLMATVIVSQLSAKMSTKGITLKIAAGSRWKVRAIIGQAQSLPKIKLERSKMTRAPISM